MTVGMVEKVDPFFGCTLTKVILSLCPREEQIEDFDTSALFPCITINDTEGRESFRGPL